MLRLAIAPRAVKGSRPALMRAMDAGGNSLISSAAGARSLLTRVVAYIDPVFIFGPASVWLLGSAGAGLKFGGRGVPVAGEFTSTI
jgi:hypothetical protein